ncbi:MAG: septum formation initiator family protein [Kiritimatiellae bacterium]|nr:septum formation initiator family protein [Verrucomicrobiota bacterium]MBU4286473.1 septum formation initiator family protein [Verrucomicrobiota bacterium]MBU4366132.1 septum formation initiator family protein [Verrucomicrobiota bacterium]MCG2660631.1 septum formation initiator family protein [Kiritimatiellia bacterium]
MNVWLTIYRVAMIVFVAMVIVAVVSLFLPKIRQNQERQRKLTILEEENRAKEDMIKQLQSQQDQFLSDSRYVERVAREELGKAKAGETIFRFSERKTNAFRVRP